MREPMLLKHWFFKFLFKLACTISSTEKKEDERWDLIIFFRSLRLLNQFVYWRPVAWEREASVFAVVYVVYSLISQPESMGYLARGNYVDALQRPERRMRWLQVYPIGVSLETGKEIRKD